MATNWAPFLEGEPRQQVQRVPGAGDVAILDDASFVRTVQLPDDRQSFTVAGLIMDNGMTLQTNGSRLAVIGRL